VTLRVYTFVVRLVYELYLCTLSFKNPKINKKSGAVLQNSDFDISHLGSFTSCIMFIVHCYKNRHRIGPCLQAEPKANHLLSSVSWVKLFSASGQPMSLQLVPDTDPEIENSCNHGLYLLGQTG